MCTDATCVCACPSHVNLEHVAKVANPALSVRAFIIELSCPHVCTAHKDVSMCQPANTSDMHSDIETAQHSHMAVHRTCSSNEHFKKHASLAAQKQSNALQHAGVSVCA